MELMRSEINQRVWFANLLEIRTSGRWTQKRSCLSHDARDKKRFATSHGISPSSSATEPGNRLKLDYKAVFMNKNSELLGVNKSSITNNQGRYPSKPRWLQPCGNFGLAVRNNEYLPTTELRIQSIITISRMDNVHTESYYPERSWCGQGWCSEQTWEKYEQGNPATCRKIGKLVWKYWAIRYVDGWFGNMYWKTEQSKNNTINSHDQLPSLNQGYKGDVLKACIKIKLRKAAHGRYKKDMPKYKNAIQRAKDPEKSYKRQQRKISEHGNSSCPEGNSITPNCLTMLIGTKEKKMKNRNKKAKWLQSDRWI